MKQSIAIIFSLGLLHYVAHGAPYILNSLLSTSSDYLNEKINKTAKAVGQVISLTNGTTQLGTSLTSSGTYMATSTAKAGLSSATTFGKEAMSETVIYSDKGLDFVSNITGSIPVVGEQIEQITGIGKLSLDLGQSTGKDVLDLTESYGKAGLTTINTGTQLTTGAIGGIAHGGAELGKQGTQAAANLITSGITRGVQAITGTPEIA
uniref:Pc61, similar to salivary secreted protein n=1 Tax=Panstrongylus chinai TaxID=156444 RepID=A0A286T5W0_9HEMI|nr:Pc61, similar to salivary secreted protein [Panstrongylus chinai]